LVGFTSADITVPNYSSFAIGYVIDLVDRPPDDEDPYLL
jgi:hypothetical protein